MFTGFLIVAFVLLASGARGANVETDEFEGLITEDLRTLRALGFTVQAYQTPPQCSKTPEASRERMSEYVEGTMVLAFLIAYQEAIEALQQHGMNRFGLVSVRFSLSPENPDAVRVVRVRVCGWEVEESKARAEERYRDVTPDHLVPFFVLYNLAFAIAPPQMTAQTLGRCGCTNAELALTAIEVDVQRAELRIRFRSRWPKPPPVSDRSKVGAHYPRGNPRVVFFSLHFSAAAEKCREALPRSENVQTVRKLVMVRAKSRTDLIDKPNFTLLDKLED